MKLATALIATTLVGCAVDEPIEESTTESAIQSGTNVPDGHVLLETTVSHSFFRGYDSAGNEMWGHICTGTVIGPRHVITAAHCKPSTNHYIGFYDNVGYRPPVHVRVTQVWERFGVDHGADDLYDTNDNYADFAVLMLADDIPAFASPAKLPHFRQAIESTVLAVGAGTHDGNTNSLERMRYRFNTIRYYGDDATLNTQEHISNPGDSGGPVYTDWNTEPMVHGVLWGYYWDYGGAGYRNRYTSTYDHVYAILDMMGHDSWSNTNRAGNDYALDVTGTRLECAIQCMQSSACSAYSWTSSNGYCRLKSAQSGTVVTQTGTTYGRKMTPACTPDSRGACRK